MSASWFARGLFHIYSRYDIPWWLPFVYFLISIYVAAAVTKRLFHEVSWLDLLAASDNDMKGRTIGPVFLVILFVSWFVVWGCTMFFLEFFQLAIMA